MDSITLNKCIKKLEANYGELPDGYSNLLSEEFISVTDSIFEKAIDQILSSEHYRPRIKDITDVIESVRKEYPEIEGQEKKWDSSLGIWLYVCPACRDTGIVDALPQKHFGRMYSYVRPCSALCEKGQQIKRTFQHTGVYHIPTPIGGGY